MNNLDSNDIEKNDDLSVADMSENRIVKKVKPADVKRVKALGCLKDKRYDDIFNVRVLTRNGKITSSEHKTIAKAAELFGNSEVALTTRLNMEIQGVPYDSIEPLREYLAEHGLETGGTGSGVRSVISCKGTSCIFGNIDTFALSKKIYERFFVGYRDVVLPRKIKIGVGGCPNNCAKPDSNDIGIVGQRVPRTNLDSCRSCKICNVERSCPMKVATTDELGKIHIDHNSCNSCGVCQKACPFGAIEQKRHGQKIMIGGQLGRHWSKGTALDNIYESDEEVLDLIEKIILFYRDEGVVGERFSKTIERLGFDYVQDKIINGEFDKTAILEKTLLTRKDLVV